MSSKTNRQPGDPTIGRHDIVDQLTAQLEKARREATMVNIPPPKPYVMPNWTITKEFHFSASHRLLTLPDTHPCHRMHGHNYVVILELSSSQLDDHGFVRDYGDLAAVKRWLDETVDHRHLNDVMPDNLTPSAEHLAFWVYGKWKPELPQLAAVGVSETPKTWAWYRPVKVNHSGILGAV